MIRLRKISSSIQGETRNCIAILHGDNQTEVLEKGPVVLEQEGQDFWNISKISWSQLK